ncbi:MAG: threonine/serine exporter family protein [Peptoniphilaceae bacterium]
MFYLSQFFIAAFATMGFLFYFNCPRKAIPISCFFSGLAWLIYKIIILKYSNYFLAGFTSAFILGLIGESAARILKKPATIFILPGLIPMVPGAGMYYSMYYLIYEDYSSFQNVAIETFYISSSLAIGIVASSAFTKFIKILTRTNKIKKYRYK